MKTEQFIAIKTKLAKWREERGLSVEDQKRNFEVNYTKELVEFFEAKRDNDEYEMIDAICDMIIVCVNAGMDFCKDRLRLQRNAHSWGVKLNLTRPILWSPFEENIVAIELMGYDPYRCLLETIKELNSRTGSWSEEEGKWVKNIGAYTKEEAQKIVQELTDCPIEFVEEKERYWGFKFAVKSSFNYTKIIKWYKADYASCKLESVK